MTYPEWSYFPRNTRPPIWIAGILGVVAAAEASIGTLGAKGPTSDTVLAVIAPGLRDLGFMVEANKSKAGKIRRPVLYGPNGAEAVSYEIDAFHDGFGIAVEVEAGRGAVNNADYRDLIRASLILDAEYLAILMPLFYRSIDLASSVQAYRGTLAMLEAIYASMRLHLPFKGVLAVGY